MRKDMVKATREALLERASKKEDKAYSTYESEALGLAFTVKRLPVARLMAIMDMGEETAEGGLETSKQLIYESIPALQDKELQERMKEAQRREVNPFATDEICDRVTAGI